MDAVTGTRRFGLCLSFLAGFLDKVQGRECYSCPCCAFLKAAAASSSRHTVRCLFLLAGSDDIVQRRGCTSCSCYAVAKSAAAFSFLPITMHDRASGTDG